MAFIHTSSSCCRAADCCASRRSAAPPALPKSCLDCPWSGHQRSHPEASLSNVNQANVTFPDIVLRGIQNTVWGPWCTCSLLLPWVTVTVHPQHVIRNLAVLLGIHLIQHDEKQVKTWQQGVLEADIFHGGFILVVLQEQANKPKKATRKTLETLPNGTTKPIPVGLLTLP